MAVTTRTVYAWRGRIRAQLQSTRKKLLALQRYNTDHPGATPPLFDPVSAERLALLIGNIEAAIALRVQAR